MPFLLLEVPLLGGDEGDVGWCVFVFVVCPRFGMEVPWATSLDGGGINISMVTWFLRSWME